MPLPLVPVFLYPAERRSSLPALLKLPEVLCLGQRNARPVFADAVSVFAEIGGRVTNGKGMHPDETGSVGIRIRVGYTERS